MSLRGRIQEIQKLGREAGNVEVERDADGQVQLFPRSVRVLFWLIVGMLVLTIVTRLVGRNAERGRGAGGVAGGLVAPQGTPTGTAGAVPAFLPEGQVRVFYAPDRNLEGADVEAVDSAKRTVDAALYSATDAGFCDALARAATRGVHVRVYRDSGQVQQEAGRGGSGVCGAALINAGVLVRVKAGGSDLMHLKSYAVDGAVLRTGSANLSVSGEKYQDNDAVFLGSARAAAGFTSDFESMWQRSDNTALPGDSRVR